MKKLKVVRKLTDAAPRQVFDIEVQDEHHYILEGGIVSHNSGPIYVSDIVVSMNKKKLKEDEFGNKTTEVVGIKSKIRCVKTRYSKPFEDVEVLIPYASGMDPYSGMFDLCEQRKVFTKEGNRYRYVSTDGTEHKLFRKNMDAAFYEMVMREWAEPTSSDPTADHEEEQAGVE